MPLSLILADMESCGIKVDKERLLKMGEEINDRLVEIESIIYRIGW